MAEVYIGINNWDDVNWYLQEGYFIGNPHGISFPGYFTLKFNLDMDDQVKALKKLVISARKKGIKVTTDDKMALAKIALPIEMPDDPLADVEGILKVLCNGIPRKNEEEKEDESADNKEQENTPEDRRKQLEKCNAFFLKVANKLTDTHRIIGSSVKWGSACLVPNGLENQVSYYGKPINSLRVACNWNWRASLKRCKDEKYIQCNTEDLPWCRRREVPEMASKPIWGNMVGYFDKDQKYHCVYGERFNRKTREWDWVEGDVDELVAKMKAVSEQMEIEHIVKQAEAMDEKEVDAVWNGLMAEVGIDEV